MTQTTQQTTDAAKERQAKQELAKTFECRDFKTLNYINDTLGTSYARHSYVQMNCVKRLLEGLEAGDRPFPKSQYMRVDGYTNAIKVLAVAIMNLDLATNTVVARDAKGVLIPAGNSLFANALNMPLRTVDEAIATLKRMGLYLSNERFKYTLDELGNKIFEGAHSIKRVCLGVFNVFDLEPALNKAIARAKKRQADREQSKKASSTRSYAISESKLGKTYAKINAARSTDRVARKIKAKSKKAAAALSAAIKPSNTQAQLDALASGSTREQLKAAITSQVDNCKDIPF